MGTPVIRGLARTLLLLPLLAVPVPALARAVDSLPFVTAQHGQPIVEVCVNGSANLPFLVDTGASHSAIALTASARLGAPRVAKTNLSTAAGSEWVAVVRLDRLDVGPIQTPAVLATELPDAWLPAGVAGVLGLDVLGTHAFTLDYARSELSWPNQPPSLDGVVNLDTSGAVWSVRVGVRLDSASMVLDSGADSVVLFDRGQWSGLSYRAGTNYLATVTSVSPGRPGVLRVLNLGRDSFVELPVVVVDGADIDRAHGDGLLPLRLFDRVTFWPREGRVQFSGARTGSSLPSFQ